MKRRNFLRAAAAAGLTGMSPLLANGDAHLTGNQRVNNGPYEGPLFVFLTALGGWDPNQFCDPNPNLTKSYVEGDIRTSGAFSYAPSVPNDRFFERMGSMSVIYNGVDMQTNNHTIGPRAAASGQGSGSLPNIAALHAATHGADLPMPYIAGGSAYHHPAGLVPKTGTRVNTALSLLMYPHEPNAGPSADSGSSYLPAGTSELIETAKQEQINRMLDAQELPRMRSKLEAMRAGNASYAEIVRLREYIPDELSEVADLQMIQMVSAFFAAGVSASASIPFPVTNGWDTHESNDAGQLALYTRGIAQLELLWDEAERLGFADRLTLLMGSDFGRHPNYNDRDNGRDHWPVTSMIAMGPGINGGRVIGASTDEYFSVGIDPETLAPSEDGLVLHPKHIHQAMRDYLEISPELQDRFPLRADDLPAGLLT